MIKYRIFSYGAKIEPVEITRESDSSIWIGKRREAKISNCYSYFDTWNDARDALLKKAENDVAIARRRLECANSFCGNVKGLEEP